MLRDKEDYATEAWCDHCKHRIGSKKSNNNLTIVGDGFDRYYLFDSFECAKEFFKEHSSLAEGTGLHGSKLTDRMQHKIRLTPSWSISRTSIAIIKSIIRKEAEQINGSRK